MPLPLISVVINTHNGEKFIKKSIKSALNQTYKNLEIIIFDNNSSDNTQDLVKNFKDKRLRYFKSKKYLKLYDARNKAVEKSKGIYLAFLDSDDWWIPGKIKTQFNYLKKKDLKIVFSNYFIYKDDTKKKQIYTNRKLPEGNISQVLLNKYDVAVQTVLIKTELLKAKKFNKKYEIIGDFDFFMNLSLKMPFGSIQKPLAYYRLHGENFSIKKIQLHADEMQHWITKNKKKFEKKKLNIQSQKNYLKKLKIRGLFNKLIKKGV